MSHVVRSLLASAAATVLTGAASAQQTVTVYVFDDEFSINPPGQPVEDAVINLGDTISWYFAEGWHTTTSVAGIPEQWNSWFLPVGSRFEHTFTHLGVWHYYCLPHGFDRGDGTAEGMAGTITVVPAPASAGVLALACAALARRRR